MELSIIVPCHNEEKNVGAVLKKIRDVVKSDVEIIVVDDGSTDNTAGVGMENGAKVIRHSSKQGKGVSIRDGIALAKNEVVLFLDGDGQDDPKDIANLLQAINHGADFVIGSRWLGELREGAISKLNYFATSMITTIINLLFNSNITDSQAGFRCVRKSKLKKFQLKARGYEIETEMLIKAIKHKLKIVEVPVTRSRRLHGTSHMKRFRLGFKILFLLSKELFTS